MVNVQEYINQQYPSFIRKNIKDINISNLNLEGKLDLKEFKNLETLYCSYNSLTKLESLEKTKLKNLYCNDNRITELDLDFLLELDDVDCSNNYINYPDLNLTNRKLVKQLQKENELLKERIAKLLLLNPSEEVETEYNEIKISQSEPDERQFELDLIDDYLSSEEEPSPTTQSHLERLSNLKDLPQTDMRTADQIIKQVRRQFQILIPPKK
jgi:Leucine-rich repeat (LRR) protein